MIPQHDYPFRGLYAANLIPLDDSAAIDHALLARHLRHITTLPEIVGILCNGHAGENHCLVAAEKRAVVETASRAIGQNKIIVSGVLAERVEDAVAEARDAMVAGADALLVFPSFSWAGSLDVDAIIAHHRAIGEATEAPIMLYQAPVGSGLSYPSAVLERLLALPRIVAIKEGSWETNAYGRNRALTARVAPTVEVMASGDEHLMPCFAIGTTGSLVSLAAILPDAIADLWIAMEQGQLARARDIHEAIQPLANLIYGRAPVSRATLRLKACMVMAGHWPSCRTKRTSDVLDEQEWQALSTALTTALQSAAS